MASLEKYNTPLWRSVGALVFFTLFVLLLIGFGNLLS